MANTRYIKKSAGGGWDIIKEGHRRATAHGGTKDEAIKVASKAVRKEGGGEIRVLNRHGKIERADKIGRFGRSKQSAA